MKTFIEYTWKGWLVLAVIAAIISAIVFIPTLFEDSCDVNTSGIERVYPEIPGEAFNVSVNEMRIADRYATSGNRTSTVQYKIDLTDKYGNIKTVTVSREEFLEFDNDEMVFVFSYTLRPYKTYSERVAAFLNSGWVLLFVIAVIPTVASVVYIVIGTVDTVQDKVYKRHYYNYE